MAITKNNEEFDTIDTTQTGGIDATFNTIMQKLNASEAITSSTTGIERKIQDAISGVSEAQSLTGERIESQFGREKDFAITQLNAQRTGKLEQRTGFATQRVALQLLEESNIKYINDLETRKQEALLANDASSALRISDLQIKAMEFVQDAKQRTFSNLLGLAGVAQSRSETQRLTSQFAQNLQQQKDSMAEATQRRIADLAGTYGVTMVDGETLESITAKIAPIVSKERAAALAADNRRFTDDQDDQGEQIDFDIFLNEIFEADPDASALDAALEAIDVMELRGIEITQDDVAKMQRRANEIKDRADAERTIVNLTAELAARQTSASSIAAAKTGESRFFHVGGGPDSKKATGTFSSSNIANIGSPPADEIANFFSNLFGE